MAGVEYQVTKVDPTDPETKGAVYQVNKVTEEVAATLGGKVYRAKVIKNPSGPTVKGKVYQIVIVDPDTSTQGKVYNAIITGDSEAVVVGPAVSPLVLPDAVAGELDYVKAFGGTEQRNLPSGYTQLEYLGSDSQAYIDTGIAGGKDTLTIECKFMYDTFVAYGGVYGNYVSDSNQGIRCILAADSSSIIVNNETICTTSGNTKLSCSINNIHTLISKNTEIILDGITKIITNKTQGNTNTENIAVLNRSIINPNTSRDIGLRVYGFKIYDADVLISNLIPCRRKSDSVLGMYDTVSRHFFTNAGTGDFIAGADVTAPSPDTPMDIVSNNGVLKVNSQGQIYADGTVETIALNTFSQDDYLNAYCSISGKITAHDSSKLYIVPCKPNTKYRFIFDNTGVASPRCVINGFADKPEIDMRSDQGIYSSSNTDARMHDTTFTTDSDINYLAFWLYYNSASQPAVDKAILYETSLGATCEPLLAVGDYTDVQSILDGVVTRNVGVMVLDGTENWTEKDQYNRVSLQITDMLDSTSPRSLPAFCNYFENLHNGEPISTIAAGQFYLAAPKRVYFHISQATAADFKQWLAAQYAAGTPVIIIYPLATATTESVAGQALQVQAGDNTLEITQASIDGLELEAKYDKEGA